MFGIDPFTPTFGADALIYKGVTRQDAISNQNKYSGQDDWIISLSPSDDRGANVLKDVKTYANQVGNSSLLPDLNFSVGNSMLYLFGGLILLILLVRR